MRLSGAKALSHRRVRQLDRINGPAWRYLNPSTDDVEPPLTEQPHHPPSRAAARDGGSWSAFGTTTTSSSDDPLEAFLALDDPCADGPTMVAMWTSLHRSCVHQSEISEAVAFAVRRVFHGLIRNKAFDAAVRFYWRLMGLGLSLRSSDIALLFSNLPYEKSVGSGKDLEGDAWLKADQQSLTWKARKAMEAARHRQGDGGISRTAASPSQAPVTATTQSAAPSCVASAPLQGCTANAQPLNPSSPSRRWLERWTVYEAAMGHIDHFSNTDADGAAACLPQLAHHSGAAATKQDNKSTYVAALLHHLCFMQKSVVAAQPTVTDANRSGAREHLTAHARSRAPYSGYWAEALHVVAHSISHPRGAATAGRQQHRSMADAPAAPPTVMDEALAQAALGALLLSPARRRWVNGNALLAHARTTSALEHRIAHVVCASVCAHQPPSSIRSAAQRRRVVSALQLASARISEEADCSYAATKHAVAVVTWAHGLHQGADVSDGNVNRTLQDMLHHLRCASEALFFETCGVKKERHLQLSNIDMHANRASSSGQGGSEDTSLHRVVPVGLELNLSLFASACGAAASAMPTLHRIAQITHQPNLQSDNIAKDLFLGQSGLFRCFELLYAPEHSNHKEYKAALNAHERTDVLSIIASAALRWLRGAIARDDNVRRSVPRVAQAAGTTTVSSTTAAAIIDQCAEVVRGIPLAARSEGLRTLAVSTVVRCLDVYSLTVHRSGTVGIAVAPGYHNSLLQRQIGDVQLMAAIARIVVLCCPLDRVAMARSMRNRPNILRSIAEHCAPQTPLGRHVRAALSANTVKLVDQLLSAQLAPGRLASSPSEVVRRRGAMAPSDVQTALIRRASAFPNLEVERLLQSRRYVDAAYRVASSGSTVGDNDSTPTAHSDNVISHNAIQLLRSAGNSWADSVSVMEALLHSVRVRSSALSIQVYGEAIRRMALPAAEHHRHDSRVEKGVADEPSSSAAYGVGEVAWQSAISLFWHAVDNANVSSRTPNGVAQDRTLAVLDETIEPLLRVCVAAGRFHEGRRWNERWQRMHAERSSSELLGSDGHLLAKLGHSVILQERDALRRLLHFRRMGPSLLQQSLGPMVVAAATSEARRGRWKEAVELICASHQEHDDLHQDADAALAVLVCLNRSGSNLYRSAMKLQRRMMAVPPSTWQPTAATTTASWSDKHSLLLLQCLNRARRWRDALAFFASPQLVDQHLGNALVLIEGLRACAQGGKHEPAAALYDTFKAAHVVTAEGSDADAVATPHHESTPHQPQPLTMGPDGGGVHGTVGPLETQRVHAAPSEASLAKSLFLRAMSKHLSRRTSGARAEAGSRRESFFT